MKKKLILLTNILLLTGCTCEYNLAIEKNTYKEEIIINGTTKEEISNLNQEWTIPVNKEEYNIGGDESTVIDTNIDTYNYQLNNNSLKLNYDFTKNSIINSSAISVCYNKITVLDYNNSIIISTSPKTNCFNEYPDLTNLTVNITVDKKVTANNADSIKGNVYTWNFTKENASNKAINLTLESPKTDSSPSSSSNKNNEQKKDYTLYIFSAILLIVLLLGYFIYNIIKSKSDMDDE